MSYRRNIKPELNNPSYVPVKRNSDTFYGGSQMWFPKDRIFSKDHILHNYGCGTIVISDLFLYLALQNSMFRSPETEVAFRKNSIIYSDNYEAYVRVINHQYTKTKRYLAVFGTKIASVINDYSDSYGFGYRASWKIRLTYYDMLEMIEEMLYQDIPVILSIGPNTPKLWGQKGIPFYTIREIEYQEDDEESNDNASTENHIEHSTELYDAAEKFLKANQGETDKVSNAVQNETEKVTNPAQAETKKASNAVQDEIENVSNPVQVETEKVSNPVQNQTGKASNAVQAGVYSKLTSNKKNLPVKKATGKKPFYYKTAVENVHGHYVTITGVIKDEVANRIMLRISSWGKQYYINYEEYRDYIEIYGDTFTSSIVRIKRVE